MRNPPFNAGDTVQLTGNRTGKVVSTTRTHARVKVLPRGSIVEVLFSAIKRQPKSETTPSFVPPDVSPQDLLPETPSERRPTLTLCVVAKNRRELDDWLWLHSIASSRAEEPTTLLPTELSAVDELIAINNEKGRFGGYAAVAERARRAAVGTVFGVTHADTAYRGGALATFRDTAASGCVAGMVGRPLTGHYVWSKQGGTMDASCLDGCAIFFRKDSGLSFDPQTFDGFHCAGEDLALSARNSGIPIVIPACDADHASTSNFVPGEKPGNKAWLKDYYIYVEKLRKKYPKLDFLVS